MSRRVTVETSMTNAKTLDRMAKKMGLKGKVQGGKYTLSGGKMVSYVSTQIDLKTGEMVGDEDNNALYDTFRQKYAVEEYLMAAEGEGYVLESETVMSDGRISLQMVKA